MSFPAPPFTHLLRLTDEGGLYEHARGIAVRPEHGYCVDDVARGLVVLCRERDPEPAVAALRRQYLTFVLESQSADGRFHNRRDTRRRWRDRPSVEDCWGRALWGLGTAVGAGRGTAAAADPAADAGGPADPGGALAAFERGAHWRSPHLRSMAFAALGAVEVLRALPEHEQARTLLAEAALVVGRPRPGTGWIWPQPRLTYANAVVPEVLLAAGAALDVPSLVTDGVLLLEWLLAAQTRDGQLSVVPVGGRGPADAAPGFDQQPIEVAALADACARAYALTGDPQWLHGLQLAAAWFLGDNDIGAPLYDPDSGGGCDGLHADRRNENQGAESTLAMISTLQCARLLSPSLR